MKMNNTARICQLCGKEFYVPMADQWAYKRKMSNGNHLYFCSWKCTRAYENKEEKPMKVTLEQKKKAVEIALAGGDYLKYLKEQGSKGPSGLWYTIKQNLQKADPEKYRQLVAVLDKKTNDEPAEKNVIESDLHAAITGKDDAPVTQSDPPGLMTNAEFQNLLEKIEDKPRSHAIPKKKLEHRVTGIMVEIGNFQYYPRTGYIDWEPAGSSETVSLNTDEWRQVMEDLPEVFRMLEVKV